MTRQAIVRTIEAVLESWESLTDKQKGPGYSKSVDRLKAWADFLRDKPDVV